MATATIKTALGAIRLHSDSQEAIDRAVAALSKLPAKLPAEEKLTPTQRAVLAWIRGEPRAHAITYINDRCGVYGARAVMRKLVTLGVLVRKPITYQSGFGQRQCMGLFVAPEYRSPEDPCPHIPSTEEDVKRVVEWVTSQETPRGQTSLVRECGLGKARAQIALDAALDSGALELRECTYTNIAGKERTFTGVYVPEV